MKWAVRRNGWVIARFGTESEAKAYVFNADLLRGGASVEIIDESNQTDLEDAIACASK